MVGRVTREFITEGICGILIYNQSILPLNLAMSHCTNLRSWFLILRMRKGIILDYLNTISITFME